MNLGTAHVIRANARDLPLADDSDMSADYCRLAEWRTNDRDQLAKVLGIAKADVPPDPQQLDLFGEIA